MRPRSPTDQAQDKQRAEDALEAAILQIEDAPSGRLSDILNDVARHLGGFIARGSLDRNKVEVCLLMATVGKFGEIDDVVSVIKSGVEAGSRPSSPPGFYEALGPNSRRRTAGHEAGHAAMAKLQSQIVRYADIYLEQVCYAAISIRLEDRIQYSLAGHCAEYLLDGVGEKFPDEGFLSDALWFARDGDTLEHGDVAHALVDILKMMPEDASDEQIFAELKRQMDICYAAFALPGARAGLERIAALLAEREYLTGNEVDRAWLGK